MIRPDRLEHAVTIVRVVDATPAEVYAAWTEPALMRRWLATVVEADVRVGGRFRLECHEADGSINAFTGEYLALEPGRRIVKTFVNVATPAGTYQDEQVEVSLRALPDGRTELTLRNGWNGQGPTPDETRGLAQGWNEWIDLLARAVAAGPRR
jgi:uncharacterized protein YndB with AHSA1/START domain